MTKAMIAGGMLIFGMLLGSGWWNAGEIVYDRVQQTAAPAVEVVE